MQRSSLLTGIGILALLTAAPVRGTVVTSLPSGTLVPMPAINVFGPGPQVFGPSITWSSTNASNQGGSVFGYTRSYAFSTNGIWDGALGPMAGLNDSQDFYGVTDTMTFAFNSSIAGVGGLINYVPGSSNPTVIAIYDSRFTLLESYNLTFLTSGAVNTRQFLGFLRNSSGIKYFTLTDNFIGITSLTVQSSAIPEPGTLILLGAGLAGLATRRHRA